MAVPQFWAKADTALNADGELTRLHDAYRAGAADSVGAPGAPGPLPAEDGALPPVLLVCVALHWSDGTVTTAKPPGTPDPATAPKGTLPQ